MRHIIYFVALIPTLLFANSPTMPIAEVVKMRGEVSQLSPGSRLARVVLLGNKFVEDTSILTGPKSFVKIRFIDNTELNIGPESKILISEMKKDSVGIISLIKGRIRTEVQKNASKPDDNKFFIRTRTAALGVRGTDFQTIYNPDNKMTSLLTYKGEVAMAKLDEKTLKKIESSEKKIERNDVTKIPEMKVAENKNADEVELLNKVLKNKNVVLVPPGQSSFASESLKASSQPVKISPAQLEALYKNQDLVEKSAANINLQSSAKTVFKPSLKIANQIAPAEGVYDEKTGYFAPKSGGFIDLNTGLYVAPSSDSTFDSKSGVYISNKIGDIDADTGQYVAPKGLTLDAKKGFIVSQGEGDSKGTIAPELMALSQDLNNNIARDIVVGNFNKNGTQLYNINEKFIRDRFNFSLGSLGQTITFSKSPFLEVNSTGSFRFHLEWQMATSNRFNPLVGIDYSIVDFKDKAIKGVSEESKKLLGLSYGFQYSLSKNINLYSKFGLHQDHYLDQTAVGGTNSYNLKKIALARLTVGGNAEYSISEKWSADLNLAGLFTFRKRINNLVINQGTGFIFDFIPKYKLSEKTWLGLGVKIENQFQKINRSVATNEESRKTSGLILKYSADF